VEYGVSDRGPAYRSLKNLIGAVFNRAGTVAYLNLRGDALAFVADVIGVRGQPKRKFVESPVGKLPVDRSVNGPCGCLTHVRYIGKCPHGDREVFRRAY
jgi:hypothetical protein